MISVIHNQKLGIRHLNIEQNAKQIVNRKREKAVLEEEKVAHD
jgi:hypothetical protein